MTLKIWDFCGMFVDKTGLIYSADERTKVCTVDSACFSLFYFSRINLEGRLTFTKMSHVEPVRGERILKSVFAA